MNLFKFLIYSFCFLLTTSLFGQTKMIAHKSHSGSMTTFKTALEESFDLKYSNFGHAPQPRVIGAVLDSLIYINDSTAVMVTSKVCQGYNPNKKRNKRESRWQSGVWQEGTDTLRHHELFSQQHALDSIKKVIDTEYNFVNATAKTKFINYDNERPIPKTEKKLKRKKKKKRKSPKQKTNKKEDKTYAQAAVSIPTIEDFSPKQFPINNLVLLIGGFAILVGFIHWKIQK